MGSKVFGELLLEAGNFADFEHFSLKNPLLLKYSSFVSLSSCTTVSEVLEVPISNIAFDFILSIKSTLQGQDSIETELRQSMMRLRDILQAQFGVTENQVQIYGAEDYIRIVHQQMDAKILMIVQVTGLTSLVNHSLNSESSQNSFCCRTP